MYQCTHAHSSLPGPGGYTLSKQSGNERPDPALVLQCLFRAAAGPSSSVSVSSESASSA